MNVSEFENCSHPAVVIVREFHKTSRLKIECDCSPIACDGMPAYVQQVAHLNLMRHLAHVMRKSCATGPMARIAVSG